MSTLGMTVWRRCSCGHAAPDSHLGPGHGIDTHNPPSTDMKCLHDGCPCTNYDGQIDKLDSVALIETEG